MKIKYTIEFDGEYNFVSIPELDGKEICEYPDDYFFDDDHLDEMHFCYTASFEPFDSDVFTTIAIQKEGGNDQLPHATSYYEQLTREEADYIIGEFINRALGIDNLELETDSTDFLAQNPDFDDEDYEDDDEDEDGDDDAF